MDPISTIKVEVEEAALVQSSSTTHLDRVASKSRIDGLKVALGRMAILRNDVMDPVRLASFSRAIAEEFADDVDALAVMEFLAKKRRDPFEAKIPELGDFLEMIRERIRERRGKERDRRMLAEVDEWKRVWERERLEDIAAGIPRVGADASYEERMSEAFTPGSPVKRKRSLLSGWTAEELRAAASALEEGREVELPSGEDGYATAARIRRQLAATVEEQKVAEGRIFGRVRMEGTTEKFSEDVDPALGALCAQRDAVEPVA